MVTPITEPTKSPFDTDLAKYHDDVMRALFFKQEMADLIALMMSLANSGRVDAAMQVAQHRILPGMMEQPGLDMTISADALNLSSDLQTIISKLQKDMNDIPNSKDPQAAAADFIQQLKDLFKNTQTGSLDWLDKNTKAQVLEAITKICGVFPTEAGVPYVPPMATNPDQLDPKIVAGRITQWVKNPSDPAYPTGISGYPPGTGSDVFRNLQAGVAESNNTVSAQSQTLNAEIQFKTQTINQLMNTYSAMIKTFVDQLRGIVQNQTKA